MDSTKLKVSVIGCGWLGLAICESLLANGYIVKTTTSTNEKRSKLAFCYDVYLFDIKTQRIAPALLDCDILIYTIPPLGASEVQTFFKSVASEQKILFISSTSVYGKSQGPCNEDSLLNPESKNGQILKKTEAFLQEHFTHATIVRPGGLYGDLRHPIYSLQGKKELKTGQDLLHLVHRDDCVAATLSIIKNNVWNEVINLVNDLRVPKAEYYPQKAQSLGLVPPQYLEAPNSNPTSLSNQKSKKLLALNYNNL